MNFTFDWGNDCEWRAGKEMDADNQKIFSTRLGEGEKEKKKPGYHTW